MVSTCVFKLCLTLTVALELWKYNINNNSNSTIMHLILVLVLHTAICSIWVWDWESNTNFLVRMKVTSNSMLAKSDHLCCECEDTKTRPCNDVCVYVFPHTLCYIVWIWYSTVYTPGNIPLNLIFVLSLSHMLIFQKLQCQVFPVSGALCYCALLI